MRRAALVMPAAAILLMAAAPSGRVFVPRAGSADYKSILEVHKDSLRSDMQIEPYQVAYINMVHTRTLSVAYVDARSITDDLVVFEQVLIRKTGGVWQSIWVDGSGGTNDCAKGIEHYTKIINFVRQRGINVRKLLPSFQDKVNQARKGNCSFGDFEIDTMIVK